MSIGRRAAIGSLLAGVLRAGEARTIGGVRFRWEVEELRRQK